MKSYLEAVDTVVLRINVLLSAADSKALRKALAPLLKRYRTRSGKDEELLRLIISAFRLYPAAYARLYRELAKANPNRWRPGSHDEPAPEPITLEAVLAAPKAKQINIALDLDATSGGGLSEALQGVSGAGVGTGAGLGSGTSIQEIKIEELDIAEPEPPPELKVLDEEVGAAAPAPAEAAPVELGSVDDDLLSGALSDEGKAGKNDDELAVPAGLPPIDPAPAALPDALLDGDDSHVDFEKGELGAPVPEEYARRREEERAKREAVADHNIRIVTVEYVPPRGQRAAPPDRPRWLLASVYDLVDGNRGEEIDAFRADAEHEVEVWIGYEALGKQRIARGRSADESVDGMLPQGEEHPLTVVFFIPALGVHQSAPLTLPRSGPSRRVRFRFAAGRAGSAIEALVSVVHKGRVLQTALLAGKALADPANAPEADRISLRLQVVVPGFGDLGQRREFDAAVVATRDPQGRAMASAVSSAGAARGEGHTVLFDEPRLDKAAKRIRRTIQRVVENPDSFRKGLNSKPALKLLWELAQHGALLHEVIGARLERELAGTDLTRLQIVQASADAFVPLEFVYDLLPPASNAKLCPNWKQALAGKPCTAAHHPVNETLNELKVVCPSGFWSVSKVIERQILEEVTAEDLQGHDFGVRSEPGAARTNLSPPGNAVFAWSEILDNAVPTASRDLLRAIDKTTGGRALPVKTWTGWAGGIEQRRPGLLVLLSHTVDDDGPLSIEIGAEKASERRTLAQINEKLVKKQADDAPVVILLGCDTAVAESDLTTFVGRFRDKGAAVVVGTITPVLGEHSAAVVQALLEEIAAAAAGRRAGRTRFGEIMRDVRRGMLARGELTALCVAAFGDADWRVGLRL